MINYRFLAILKREIKTQILTKKFIIVTLSFPLVMALIIGVQAFLVTYQEDKQSSITILTESENFQSQLQEHFQESEINDDELFMFNFDLLTSNSLDDYISENRESLLKGTLTGVLYIPDTAREDKQLTYYSVNPSNQTLLSRLRTEVNRSVINQYFSERNIDQASIEYARMNVRVDGIRITEEGNSEENIGNLLVAGLLTFLLYMNLLISGPIVMGAVSEEKTNKIVEVLLSSVKPSELMAGKVIGTATSFLAMMTVWLLPLFVLSLSSLPLLATINESGLNLDGFGLLYYLFNYGLGLLIYLSIFSAFGALFDSPQDAQSATFPIIMLIMIPFFFAMTMAQNPANTLAEVGSMLPFFSIIIMPARMTLIDVPLWQIGIAVIVNLATFYCVIKAAGKLYRVAILVSGKRPTWKELYHWVRYS